MLLAFPTNESCGKATTGIFSVILVVQYGYGEGWMAKDYLVSNNSAF